MSRKLVVKVCGMQRPDNVRVIARYAPEYLGFIFVPDSPRYVDPAVGVDLLQSVPATIRTVAVFRNAELSAMQDVVKRCNFSAVQLHGEEDSDYIAAVRRVLPSCQVFKAVSIGQTALNFEELPQGADLYIFDGARPGSGAGFDWSVLGSYRGVVPFFIAGGIGCKSIAHVREFSRSHRMCIGVDINSQVELSPGVKDEAAVRDVIREIRTWE